MHFRNDFFFFFLIFKEWLVYRGIVCTDDLIILMSN